MSIYNKNHDTENFLVCPQAHLLPIKKRTVRKEEQDYLSSNSFNLEDITLRRKSMKLKHFSPEIIATHPELSYKNLRSMQSSLGVTKAMMHDEMILMKKYEQLCKRKFELIESLSSDFSQVVPQEDRTSMNTFLPHKRMKKSSPETPRPSAQRQERTVFDEMWQQRYDELVKFWKENGHCSVPQRYPPNKALGKWVHKQRQEFKKKRDGELSSLTSYRIAALQKIGFQVDTTNRAEALWQQRYKELMQFKIENGHCNVPQKFAPNKALGKWVHRQRHEFKKMRDGEPTFLTQQRIDDLEKIGFQMTSSIHKPASPEQHNGDAEDYGVLSLQSRVIKASDIGNVQMIQKQIQEHFTNTNLSRPNIFQICERFDENYKRHQQSLLLGIHRDLLAAKGIIDTPKYTHSLGNINRKKFLAAKSA